VFEDHPAIDAIYIACKEDYIKKLEKLIRVYMLDKVRKIVPGGTTGQDSIRNALLAAREDYDEDTVALIHDGVRPCILPETIDDDLACVAKNGNAVTCTSMVETPVISENGNRVEDLPPRSIFFTAQAPQCFRLGQVLEAHRQEQETNPNYEGVIDTCTLMKRHGHEIFFVSGPRGNIKVTTPEDLYIFKAMLEYRETRNAFGLGVGEGS
jgi:2-C-methyl-D-erythritol 4-phosphate cytidylyltransferase